jgi:hypothetical protein
MTLECLAVISPLCSLKCCMLIIKEPGIETLESWGLVSETLVGSENSGYEAVERPAVVNVVEESALVVNGPEVNPAISGLLASMAARNAGDGVLPTNSCSESIMVYPLQGLRAGGEACGQRGRLVQRVYSVHSYVLGSRLRRGCVLLDGGGCCCITAPCTTPPTVSASFSSSKVRISGLVGDEVLRYSDDDDDDDDDDDEFIYPDLS